MLDGKYLNATESASFLGCSRDWFYTVKEKYKLEPVAQMGFMKLYNLADLKKIKKAISEK